MTRPTGPLISTAELAAALAEPDLRIVDASLAPIGADLRPEAGFRDAHLPGAVFFDIDAHKDADSDLPHMLPKPRAFAAALQALGIGDGMRVVVYDQIGTYSAARFWWQMRAMGHEEVQVLDGGLPKWRREGRPLADDVRLRHPTLFTPVFRADLVRDYAQMRKLIEEGGETVLDVRPRARFAGRAPEPRAGLRSGRMPGAHNIPFADFTDADGAFKSPEALRAMFLAAGIDPQARIVASCGSGLTAAIALLALAVLGNDRAALYDGSWAEWGREGGGPVIGAAD